MKDLGRWTTRFGELIRESRNESSPLYIKGPFFAPAVQAVHESKPLLIAAGIGITPFISVCHHAIFNSVSCEVTEKRNELCFAAADVDQDGELDKDELANELRRTGVGMDAVVAINNFDNDGDGALDTAEFQQLQSHLNSETKSAPRRCLNPEIERTVKAAPRWEAPRRPEQVKVLWMVREFALTDFFISYMLSLLKLHADAKNGGLWW